MLYRLPPRLSRVFRPGGSVVEIIRMHTSITAVGGDLTVKLRIYPDPADGTLHVEWGSRRTVRLQLVDLTGRKVWMQYLTADTVLNVGDFKRGSIFCAALIY